MTLHDIRKFKIVVTGNVGSGKKRLIRTLTDPWNEDPDREPIIQNFGRLEIDEVDGVPMTVYLLASLPGQKSAMIQGSADELLAIVMVNSADPGTFEEARRTIEFLEGYPELLYVVAASFQDVPGACPPASLRESLNIPDAVPVIPCVATDFESARHVLLSLLHRFLQQAEM